MIKNENGRVCYTERVSMHLISADSDQMPNSVLSNHDLYYMHKTQVFLETKGTPVAQWVKRWPTDLAVLSSSPTPGKIF